MSQWEVVHNAGEVLLGHQVSTWDVHNLLGKVPLLWSFQVSWSQSLLDCWADFLGLSSLEDSVSFVKEEGSFWLLLSYEW